MKSTVPTINQLLPAAAKTVGSKALAPADAATSVVIPRGAFDPTSITGKRGGRPKGAKSKTVKHIRELLAAADDLGVKFIEETLKDDDCPRQLKIQVLALAWAYRWGKPREMRDPDAVSPIDGQPTDDDGKAISGMRIVVGGTTIDYVADLRKLRTLAQPPPAPEATATPEA